MLINKSEGINKSDAYFYDLKKSPSNQTTRGVARFSEICKIEWPARLLGECAQ